jgi:acyl-CoA synthetase (NDP forming)
VRDAEALSAAARKAHAAGKPVVAYKLGRSALGEALARSHTGALAGADAALDAFFRDSGIIRVDMLETLIEIAPLVLKKPPLDLKRKARVAVVTTTGGGAASVVDRLGLAGIETVGPSADKPIHDLTMAATPQKYRETLEKLLADRECDAVLACVGSSAQFHPQLAIEPILGLSKEMLGEKALGVFATPHAERSLALLAEQGIAAFRTPEGCADALASYFNWHSPREKSVTGTPVFHDNVFSLIESLGIPIVEQAIATAPEFAHSIPYPVAVKVLDAEHKTEVGGVALNVASQEEFLEKARGWKKENLLIQKMESGLGEVIVGFRRDPVVGPVVLVGAGGTLTELYRDFTLSMAPVSPEEAMRMIERVRGLAVLRGYRNLPRGDVQALAEAVSALSRLCFVGRILEAEINPLIVKSRGVVAVDALMLARP